MICFAEHTCTSSKNMQYNLDNPIHSLPHLLPPSLTYNASSPFLYQLYNDGGVFVYLVGRYASSIKPELHRPQLMVHAVYH